MNVDTTRSIAEIRKNGYFRQSQGLGEGGWEELSETADWKRYLLFIGDQPEAVEKITAKDDETAIKAFNELYNLDEDGYEIFERITKHRLVYPNLEGGKDVPA